MTAARRLERAGDVSGAASVYADVLSRFPKNKRAAKGLQKLDCILGPASMPSGRFQDCVALFRQGKHSQALALGHELAAKGQSNAPLANLMGAIHMSTGDRHLALDWFGRAAKLLPGDAAIQNNLGLAQSATGDQAGAIHTFRVALSIKTPFPQGWNNLGLAYRAHGEIETAATCFEQAIKEDPLFAEAHHNLSAVHQFEDGDDYSVRLSQVFDETTVAKDKCLLAFAVAKAKEAHQDYQEAFNHLLIGNQLRKAELGYTIEQDKRLFKAIEAAFPVAGKPSQSQAFAETPSSQTPIFVVGLPRSGSTLVEQILSCHDQVRAVGEVNALDRAIKPFLDDFLLHPGEAKLEEIAPRIRASYLAEMSAGGGAETAFTDKMPINFRWAGFIAAAFPEARIVVVERDPKAVMWSNFKTHFSGGGNGFAYDLNDLAAYHALYSGMMEHWSRRLPGRVHRVDYERLVTDSRSVVQDLLAYCELPWSEACLSPHANARSVDTASAVQVRKKIYRGSSQNWRRYEPFLQAYDGFSYSAG